MDKLDIARELIQKKKLNAARELLETLPGDSTAKAWLAKLEEVQPQWEYKVLMFFADELHIRVTFEDGKTYSLGNRPDLHLHLNKLGKEGWLVTGNGPAMSTTLGKSVAGTLILRKQLG